MPCNHLIQHPFLYEKSGEEEVDGKNERTDA
jgi:hypothetical protein